MKMIALKAEAKAGDATAKNLRRESRVPCVLYGNDVENTQLTCDYSEIYRAYAQAGESVLVELDAAGKNVPVLFHAVQFEPVSDKIVHVDFYAVDMKKEIEARVPLHFTGESEAVKSLGGVLVTVMDHVTVKCLPGDLPQDLEVSIEGLKEFSDELNVADLTVPSGVTIVDSPDARIATVQEPRREETTVEAVAEGEEAAEGAEGAAAEAKEGEASAEGEAPKEDAEAKSE